MEPDLIEIKEESVARHFLSSDLYKQMLEYQLLEGEYLSSEKSVENITHFMNTAFITLGWASLISSLGSSALRGLAIGLFIFFVVSLLNPNNLLRKISQNKSVQSIWMFVSRGKVIQRDILKEKYETKAADMLSLLNKSENKALIARIYKHFHESNKNIIIKQSLSHMLICYQENNTPEVLNNLSRILDNLSNILKSQYAEENADNIANNLIKENNTQAEIKSRIFKKKKLYEV